MAMLEKSSIAMQCNSHTLEFSFLGILVECCIRAGHTLRIRDRMNIEIICMVARALWGPAMLDFLASSRLRGPGYCHRPIPGVVVLMQRPSLTLSLPF